MATVICKRSIMFRNEAKATILVKNNEGKEELQVNPNAPTPHSITASKDPQNIPDWVTQQPAFRHAVEHGDIILLQVIKPANVASVEKAPLPEIPGLVGSTAPNAPATSVTVQLEKLSKAELLEHARGLGIEVDEKLKKEEILAAIKQEIAKT